MKLKRVFSNIRTSFDRRETVHFLHLRKNAGSQVKDIALRFNEQSSTSRIAIAKHSVPLRKLPEKASYFFSIRNPTKRFVSGFYCRKRKGRPRYNSPWSEHERQAFADFEHANELAESLYLQNQQGYNAISAIKSLRHTLGNQIDWFERLGYFMQLNPPLHIIRQEAFDTDIEFLLSKIDDSVKISPTSDYVKSHKSDYSAAPALSPLAVRNLELWYSQDYQFYNMCSDWIEQNRNCS